MKNVMIPEGYEKLAAIGIAYKGVYEASREYGILNAVYHNGSTFVSLKDAPQGEPTGDGVNWQYLAKGFVENLLTSIQATDTSGIAGTAGERLNAQSLLDVIADRVANKLIDKNKIVNGLTSTDATAVLAAPQGKALKDEIGEVNRKLTSKSGIAIKGAKFSADTTYIVKNGICFAICEAAPNSPVVHGDIFCSGLPEPIIGCYLSLSAPNGNYSALLKPDGSVMIYYPLYTQPERIDCCFCYPIK